MPSLPEKDEAAAVALGLRVGLASALCLLLTEVFHLSVSALAVYSAHMTMSQFTFTAFQKGVERVLGRALGVLLGLILVGFVRDAPFVFTLLVLSGMMVFYYFYAAKRLAYAALNGGLFLGYMAIEGRGDPTGAVPLAENLIQQISLGVGVAFAVNWLTRAESSLTIVTSGEPLWPIRLAYVSRASRSAVAMFLTMHAAVYFALPTLTATISAGILTSAPDEAALEKKAWERTLGALLGSGYALVSILLLSSQPHFPLYIALLFFGMFLAAYNVKALGDRSYIAVQAGLVLPMVLIGPREQLGTLTPGLERVVGVALGMIVSEAVYRLWLFRTS